MGRRWLVDETTSEVRGRVSFGTGRSAELGMGYLPCGNNITILELGHVTVMQTAVNRSILVYLF